MPSLLDRIKKYAKDNEQTSRMARRWASLITYNMDDIDTYQVTMLMYHDIGLVPEQEWAQITEQFPEWFKDA